ncbi:hypothetical protein C8248_17760, partial [Paracidovorax avenae]
CDCYVTRSGYTGEDGFEISVPAGQAEALAPALLAAGQAVPASGALPRYVRDKVAQTTSERAAAREAASVAGNPSSATGAGASPQP